MNGTAAISVDQAQARGGTPQTFYVPHCTIRVEGSDLPPDVLLDVMRVGYSDSVSDIDSFDLLVNNWDAERRAPKYEPPATPALKGIFDPGRKIELRLGYLGDERLMLRGQITTLEPRFPESGGPTLSVRGLNVLHSLRREQHTFSWEKERDSVIATELGDKPVTRERPGLGLEVRVDEQARGNEEAGYVFMNNQYDIVFLLERARLHGYTVFLGEEAQAGGARQFLYFGPSKDDAGAPAPTYRLEVGRTLISFLPTLSTAHQVSEVEVRGWDRRRKEAIVKTATLKDLPSARRRELEALGAAIANRREVVTDRPVHTPKQAADLARKILAEQAGELVRATAQTVGLPDLRAGRTAEIAGAGERFDGEYFIEGTRHTLGESGYRTELRGRRLGPAQGGSP